MRTVTLLDWTPIPLFGAGTWTQARIEEAPAATGPWEVLEVKNAVIAGEDPAAPQPRNFSTNLAALEQGWYRVVWMNSEGGESPADPYPDPVGEPGVSAASVRDQSELLEQLFPAGDAAAERRLGRLVRSALALLEPMLCVRFADLPEAKRALGLLVVAMKVERMATTRGAQDVAGATARSRLRSISAGSWSETYFGPGEATASGRLDPDDDVNAAMWQLMDDACRQRWLLLWDRQAGREPAVEPQAWVEEAAWMPDELGWAPSAWPAGAWGAWGAWPSDGW